MTVNLAALVRQQAKEAQIAERRDIARTGDPIRDAFALRDAGRHAEAVALLEPCMAEGRPERDNPYLWRILALLHADTNNFPKGMAAYQQALKFEAANPLTLEYCRMWHEAALMALGSGAWGQAREWADMAVELLAARQEAGLPVTPGEWYAPILTRAGLAFRRGEAGLGTALLREVGEAELSPETTGPQRYLSSLARLTLRYDREGWVRHEGRLANATYVWDAAHHPAQVRWDASKRGRVVVWKEQGAGDLIQMLRYLPRVADASGHPVTVRCDAGLAPVVERTPGVGRVVGLNDAVDDADWQVPIMSLPLALGVDAPPPVVTPTGWAWTPPRNARPRVGLCWRGNPDHANDHDRSAPLASLGPLAKSRGISWVSLVPGEAPSFGETVELPDYAATADVLLGLDALVTVDTSVAHLAGTLGVPTWLVPPSAPEWRWGLNPVRQAWYPSVRLVRRFHVHGWERAWRDVAKQVDRFAKEAA